MNKEEFFNQWDEPIGREEFIENETGDLYWKVNDPNWRQDMYYGNHKGYVPPSKRLLTKAYWITQRSVMEYLTIVFEAEPESYTNEVKELINDKDELRKVAKEIIVDL